MRDDKRQIGQDQADPNAIQTYFRAIHQHEQTFSPARRPWLLAVLAQICTGLVIAGSLGPWMYYERVSKVVPSAWTLYGVRTDGVFTLMFAIIAFITLPYALFKPDSEDIAWVSVVTLGLCALAGLLGWFVFAPPEISRQIGQEGNIQRVEWGMKLVALAGTAGTILTFIIARLLNRN